MLIVTLFAGSPLKCLGCPSNCRMDRGFVRVPGRMMKAARVIY